MLREAAKAAEATIGMSQPPKPSSPPAGLSAKHVVDFVFHGNRSAAIDDRSSSSISGELEEVIAF